MKRAGILVLAGALVATVVAAADPTREREGDFRSQAIGGTLHYVVYLPVGYGTSGLRYPVVYFLHGLPSSGTAYRSVGFVEPALGAANDVHRQLQGTRARLRRLPTYIAFYVGSGDSRFAAENEQLNQELARAGIPHVFRFYPGGHGQALWGKYAGAWVSLALANL